MDYTLNDTLEKLQTIKIEGEEYWNVRQFALLTERSEQTVRLLTRKGNRIRKLKAISLSGRTFIPASELFNFPFIVTGRPAGMGDFIEKYYDEEGELIKNEEIYKEDGE